MSLMEVVLALAILGVSLAMIGELIRIGSRAGEAARDDMEKQLIAESLINEIASSAVYPEPVFEQPIDSLGEWLYTVEAEAVDEAGLLAVRVTIRKADDTSTRPPYSLIRWMMDPEVEASAREAQLVMEEQLKLRAQAQSSGTQTENGADSSSQGTSPQTPGGQSPMGSGNNGLPPGFDPSQLPPGFDPRNFDPSKLPPGFDPKNFDPSKLPPGLIPGGRGNRGGGGGNDGPRNPGSNGPGNNGPGGRGVRGGGRGNGS